MRVVEPLTYLDEHRVHAKKHTIGNPVGGKIHKTRGICMTTVTSQKGRITNTTAS